MVEGINGSKNWFQPFLIGSTNLVEGIIGSNQMVRGGQPIRHHDAIGSLAAQRAPGLMCGALLNKSTPNKITRFEEFATSASSPK